MSHKQPHTHATASGYVGNPVPRREDERFMTGRGRYLADISVGALSVVFVRSAQPHAIVDHIDTALAGQMPGVVGVFTGADLGLVHDHISSLHVPHPAFVHATAFRMAEQRLAIMPVDRVHYVGQPLVAVIAVDRYAAEDAAEAVEIEYTSLPPALDADAALRPDATPIHPHLADNEAASIHLEFGGEAVEERGHLTVEGTYRIGRHGAVPLEGRGVLARVDARRVSVWTSTQIPHMVRRGICEATGWSTEEVRVTVPDVGGGFGTKANIYAEEIIVAVLARRIDRDLEWVEDRQEHLISAAQGRDQTHRTRLTVDSNGRIVHWQDNFTVDVGAGGLWVAGVVANTAIHGLGPYRIPGARIVGRAAFTTKTITAQYRGAGRPEACFALERSLDDAARALGLSGAEIRRRNLLTSNDLPYPRPLPYRDGVDIVFDGGDYAKCLEAALELLPSQEVARQAREHAELRVGYGVACYLEATGRGPYETGRVRLTSTGHFEVASGAASAGQAHETSFAQVAADALCADLAHVHVRQADTDLTEHGIGTFASRSAVLAGSAIRNAAHQVRSLATDRAAKLLGVPRDAVELAEGVFSSPSDAPGAEITWADLARACAPGGTQEQLGPLDVTDLFRGRTVTWTMGAHVTIVGVHRRTGAVQVLAYAVAHEGGVEINPQVVQGQIIGGVAQGIGGALLEEFRYSPEGQPQSTTFADYLLPSALDVPDVRIQHLAVATPDNPLAVRGAGESGTIAVAAAIASAIEDALDGQVRVRTTPISPAALHVALEQELRV